MKKINLIIILFMIFVSNFIYSEVVVIVKYNNNQITISRSLLKNIFLGKKTRWPDGKKISAINLHPSLKVRKYFEETILKMSSRKVQKYWVREAIKGNIKPPHTVSSEREMCKAVAKNRNAIGYVDWANIDAKYKKTLKIIKIKN